MTPERYAEMVATTDAMGRARYETVALTPDRQVVAQSTLAMSLEESTKVYQWGTFVHREHRGHKLGLATKAVNLRAVQAARDDLTLVVTQNAETNDYMVAINERMGFRPIEVAAESIDPGQGQGRLTDPSFLMLPREPFCGPSGLHRVPGETEAAGGVPPADLTPADRGSLASTTRATRGAEQGGVEEAVADGEHAGVLGGERRSQQAPTHERAAEDWMPRRQSLLHAMTMATHETSRMLR